MGADEVTDDGGSGATAADDTGDDGVATDAPASAAVVTGATNPPPSRTVGVVVWPQPATTAINTKRLIAPSPEASLSRSTMPLASGTPPRHEGGHQHEEHTGTDEQAGQ